MNNPCGTSCYCNDVEGYFTTDCGTTFTPCLHLPITTTVAPAPPVFCQGEITWVWMDTSGDWVLYSGSCFGECPSGGPCICSPPSYVGTDCAVQTTDCYCLTPQPCMPSTTCARGHAAAIACGRGTAAAAGRR